ncbi:MAG: tRNA sulfurtransferase [Candidatus Njordarchaeum guaymaensis]
MQVYNSLIIRFSGEIKIKSRKVRDLWEKLIYRQIKEIAKDDVNIIKEGIRAYLIGENVEYAIPMLTKIFGISSISPAIKCDIGLRDIAYAMLRLVRGKLTDTDKQETFGIIVDKNLSKKISSRDLKIKLGDLIRQKFDLQVNLDNPTIPIHVDIRGDFALVYTEKIPGPGGIPLGTQAPVVALLSGGPDSTLATWLAMKRGSYVVGIYLDFGDEDLRSEARSRVLKISRILAKDYKGLKKLYIIPFTEVTRQISESDLKNYHVLLKRYMIRIAEEIAKKEKAMAIVTGEIIGEHASQTVHNLRIITEAAKEYPIFRPVISYDKSEIFKKLKEIDENLYRLANQSIEPCRLLSSVKPTTKADLEEIKEIEKALDTDKEFFQKIVLNSMIITF